MGTLIDIKTKFGKAILFTFLIFIVIAIADFLQYPNSFWIYTFMLGITISAIYYIFKPDLSEALAVFLTFVTMLLFGLEDLIFYLINTQVCVSDVCGFPASMPHLFEHTFIGGVAKAMGLITVTTTSLVVSVFIGFIISIFIIKWLKKAKW